MSRERVIQMLGRHDPLLLRLSAVPGLYLVGGYLRDLYYGLESKDIDLALAEPFADGLQQIEKLLGTASFELSERFGSQRFSLDGRIIDLSPLAADGIGMDLARRDYGVNALGLELSKLRGELRPDDLLAADATLEDLDARRLRSISPDNLRDDPLRVLRGYRLAAVHGFSVDADTRQEWRSLAGSVLNCAAERVHEELLSLFGAGGDISGILRDMAEDGLLFRIFPGLELTAGCAQNSYHHLDVWEHTLEALVMLHQLKSNLPPELESYAPQLQAELQRSEGQRASVWALTRISLLLHDIAKPPTRAVREDGHVTFHNHQDIGADQVLPRLRELRFSADEISFITLMIRQHLRLGFYCRTEPLSRKLIYRYVRELGAAAPAMLLHSIADCMATRGRLNDGSLSHHLRAAGEILAQYYSEDSIAARPPLLLSGSEIMELLEIGPGRVVGELKDALLEATAGGEVESEDEARCFVRDMYEIRRKES